MPAGLNANLTKQSGDQTVGDACQRLNIALADVGDAKRFVDVHDDAALVSLGYDPADVANIRSALADLDQLRRIYEGLEALASAKDFRSFSQRLYGTGYVPGR